MRIQIASILLSGFFQSMLCFRHYPSRWCRSGRLLPFAGEDPLHELAIVPFFSCQSTCMTSPVRGYYDLLLGTLPCCPGWRQILVSLGYMPGVDFLGSLGFSLALARDASFPKWSCQPQFLSAQLRSPHLLSNTWSLQFQFSHLGGAAVFHLKLS